MASTVKGLTTFLKTFWKIPRFYLALLALLLPALLLWQNPVWRSPYRLVESDTFVSNNNFGLYHDFDRDGVSELIIKQYDPGTKTHSLKIGPDKFTVIQQINFTDSLRAKWLFYGDYTLDGYDELITFTQNRDSLFLSIVDVRPDEHILKRHLLLTAEQLSPTKMWDVNRIKAYLINTPEGRPENLLFTVDTERALYPRSVYLFNIPSRQILYKFETDASLEDIFLWDLSSDFRKEIVVFANAADNVKHPKTPYDDDRCWLFVLDQELKPVFEPLAFGEFPVDIQCQPVIYNDQPALVVGLTYSGSKAIPSEVFYVTPNGKKIPGWQFFGKILSDIFVHPFDQSLYFVTKKFLTSEKSESIDMLMHLTPDLKPAGEIILRNNQHLVFMNDLNSDRKMEFGFIDDNLKNFFILNEEMIEIARYPMTGILSRVPVTFKDNKQAPKTVGLNSEAAFQGLTLHPNRLYTWLPVLYLGAAGMLFLLLVGMEGGLSRLLFYRRYFQYNQKAALSGRLLVDAHGKIHQANERFPELFNIAQPLKKQHVAQVLRGQPTISNFIAQCLQDRKAGEQSFSVMLNGRPGTLSVRVLPMFSSFPAANFYQVEIAKADSNDMSERLLIWSKTSQKIAHDIKSPLSGLALNLKTLQKRVDKLTNGQKDKMTDDIEMMQVELDKIRNLTRKFLQFVDLEKPHFQAVAFEDILKNILKRFAPFSSDGLAIETNIEPELPLLWADSYMIETVLTILIENAIDALLGRGVIEISAVLAQYLESIHQKMVEIEVADTGAGIDESLKEKIFDLHYSTKLHGSGIGLANAKKIVESHDGQIEVYSRKGFATVFRFSIPVFEENGSKRD